jgi:hypothetical protein
MLLWSDDSGDSTGASLESQEGVMDGVIQSFPAPRLVLQHSTVNTSESSSSFKERQTKRGDIDDSPRCSRLCGPQTPRERVSTRYC